MNRRATPPLPRGADQADQARAPGPGPLRAIVVGALLLPLVACTAWSPTYPITQANSAEQTAGTLQPWWADWSDAALDTLIAQALRANPSVAAARQAVVQARAQFDVRLASLRPSLTLGGSVQRTTSDGAGTTVNFRTSADASWELDLFDANRASVQASSADVLASAASLRDAQLSLSAEVALTELQRRSVRTQIDTVQAQRANLTLALALTQARVSAGLASAADLAQARQTLAQTEGQLPTLLNTLAALQHSLAILQGQTPAAAPTWPPLDAGPVALPQPTDPLPTELPADRVRQRADVRAAQARVQAALAAVDAAEAARWPSFRLGGSVGLTALTFTGLGSAAAATQVLGSISVPVLDGGARAATVRVQTAALEQTRLHLAQTVLTALKEVQDGLVAIQAHRQRLQTLQAAESDAATLFDQAQARRKAGLIDQAAVLGVERSLLAARDARLSAQADLVADRVRLIKALGGTWSDSAAVRETAS